MSSQHELVDQVETTELLADVMYKLRQFAEARRQFSVVFNHEGAATISGPKIGARNPAEPQPTPSLAQAAA
jgi:hypothetical protein